MDHDDLKRRYTSLWIGEATAILVFIGLFLYHALPDGNWSNWIARVYALTIVILILIQGILWWHWKLRILQAGERTMPIEILRLYRRLRWINWLLIALFPIVLWLKWNFTKSPQSSHDWWIGLLIIGGAVLEQVNYYYVQLMYDNPYDWNHLRKRRCLRQGSIGKALNQLST